MRKSPLPSPTAHRPARRAALSLQRETLRQLDARGLRAARGAAGTDVTDPFDDDETTLP